MIIATDLNSAGFDSLIEARAAQAERKLCRNALAGEKAWHCYHWNGRITSGKEDVDENGDCESCRIAKPPYEEEPSFMSRNED